MKRDAETAARSWVAERDGFLDPATAAALYERFRDLRVDSAEFYIAECDRLSPATRKALGWQFPPQVVDFLIRHLGRLLEAAPPAVRAAAHGFEIWTSHVGRVEEPRSYVHIDNDEALRARTGNVRPPLMGSVLYLGPAAGLAGGETYFIHDAAAGALGPVFRFFDWAELSALGPGIHVTRPVPGRLAMFAGHMPHGQAPVTRVDLGAPRVVFLANIWDAPIGC